ncbi:hypothetical protein pb186bvf_002118 [Paramecium bursaria]
MHSEQKLQIYLQFQEKLQTIFKLIFLNTSQILIFIMITKKIGIKSL